MRLSPCDNPAVGSRTLVVAGLLAMSVAAGCGSDARTTTTTAGLKGSPIGHGRIVPAPPPTDADSLTIARSNARNIAEIARRLPAGTTRLGSSPDLGVRYRVPGLTKQRVIDIWHRSASLPNVYRLLGINEYKEPAGPLVVAGVEITQSDGVACTYVVEMSWRATIPNVVGISSHCQD
jgi:hypothetical protein